MTTIDLVRRRPYLRSPRLKLCAARAESGAGGKPGGSGCAGLLVRNVSFASLGSDWVTVSAVAVGTLALSIAGGALLGMHRDVSPLTGGLSLVVLCEPQPH